MAVCRVSYSANIDLDALYDRSAPRSFCRGSSICEVKTSPKTWFWKITKVLPDDNPHGLGTQHEPCKTEGGGFPTILPRLRSPVIQKTTK